MTDPNTIAALIDTLGPACKMHGVRRLRVGDLELEFGGAGPIDPKQVDEFQRAFDKGMPSDDDALYHSVPGYVPTNERPPVPSPPKTARGAR